MLHSTYKCEFIILFLRCFIVEYFSAFGSAIATGLPSGIDRDGEFNYQSGLGMSFHLKPGIILQTGIVYQWSKFSMDGYFTVENNNTIFKQTPAHYKQHSLIIERINLPLKVKKVFDEQAATGVGIINSYIVSSASKYKIDDSKSLLSG
jgi:hypothetical protein